MYDWEPLLVGTVAACQPTDPMANASYPIICCWSFQKPNGMVSESKNNHPPYTFSTCQLLGVRWPDNAKWLFREECPQQVLNCASLSDFSGCYLSRGGGCTHLCGCLVDGLRSCRTTFNQPWRKQPSNEKQLSNIKISTISHHKSTRTKFHLLAAVDSKRWVWTVLSTKSVDLSTASCASSFQGKPCEQFKVPLHPITWLANRLSCKQVTVERPACQIVPPLN